VIRRSIGSGRDAELRYGLVDFTDQEADFCGACLQAGEPIGGVELDT
jgi:hypothetical protein